MRTTGTKLGAVVVALALGLLLVYGPERGSTSARAADKTSVLDALSTAFRDVSRELKPSVVSIKKEEVMRLAARLVLVLVLFIGALLAVDGYLMVRRVEADFDAG